jgi:YebC/PmpR family DNA-binding regulatory protein
MSGHSKWSTIKRQKGAKDAARGAIFTKLGNNIAVAARNGTDPETNFALRLAIDKAKAENMPLANIQRAIDRQKDKDAAQLQELLYEGYGPGGVAIMVECTTDNVNRTYSDVKVAFNRHGGSMAEIGSVAFQFYRQGMIRLEQKGDLVLEKAIEAGAEDVVEEDDCSIIYTDPKELNRIRLALTDLGFKVLEAELVYVPKTTMTVDNVETAGKVLSLMEALEDLEDVSATYVNFDIPQPILAQLN